MLRLSKRADYALMALKHLASAGSPGSASTREISETYGIPVELLAKVLQRLVRAGLLRSQQGLRGGYGLARPAQAIPIVEVLEAVEGPLTMTACTNGPEGPASCEQYERCTVRDPLWRITRPIMGALASATIADLLEPIPAMPVALVRHRVPGSQDGRGVDGEREV